MNPPVDKGCGMWLGSTALTEVSGPRRSRWRGRVSLRRVSSKFDERDLERLLRSEADVSAFALGEFQLNIDAYANPAAVFVDVNGVLHSSPHDLPGSAILGVEGSDYEIDSLDFSTSNPVIVSIAKLKRRGTESAPKSIVWTKTWQFTGKAWRILSSHASWSH